MSVYRFEDLRYKHDFIYFAIIRDELIRIIDTSDRIEVF